MPHAVKCLPLCGGCLFKKMCYNTPRILIFAGYYTLFCDNLRLETAWICGCLWGGRKE